MKKAVVLLAEGFEEIEAMTVVDVLRRADVVCDICSLNGQTVKSTHGITVKADVTLKDANFDQYDAVVLPGGMPGAANLRDNERVIELVKNYNAQNKIVAAICAAPIVLEKAGIIKGRKVTSYPDALSQPDACKYGEELVIVDGNIITSRGPATSIYFALAILEKLGLKDKAMELKEGMMFNFAEQKIRE